MSSWTRWTPGAALEDKGADEALTRVWESMPGTDLDTRLAKVRATGHPDAAKLAQARAEFAASGAPNSIDQVAELKVSLPGPRPLIWRRARVNRELRQLRSQVAALEERRAALLSELGEK